MTRPNANARPSNKPEEPSAETAPPAPLGIDPPGDDAPALEPPSPPPSDDAPQAKTPAPSAGETKRKPAAPPRSEKPQCPYCKIPCQANRSEAYFTRYYCPTGGCNYSVKVPRPQMQQRLTADRAAEQEGFSAR